MRPYLVVLLGLISLAACTANVVPTAPESVAVIPLEWYADALNRGAAVYRVAPAQSEIVVRVYRGGALARFGHDHVVATRETRGYVAIPTSLAQAHADFYFPVASLQVDEPAKRAEAGFETQPSVQDIEGTRRNMMGKVLEAERFPFVRLQVSEVQGEPPQVTLRVALTLHGVTRVFPVMAEVEANTASLAAHGRFSINQSDFGITSFSVLGGMLQVQDRLDIDFQFTATRVAPGTTLGQL